MVDRLRDISEGLRGLLENPMISPYFEGEIVAYTDDIDEIADELEIMFTLFPDGKEAQE